MKNVQTIIVNGYEVSGSVEILRSLLGIAVETSEDAMEKAPGKPKGKHAKKQEPEAPKAEEAPKEPVYTKGGCVVQYPDNNTLLPIHKAKVSKAVNALSAQGFTVTWKRIGSWVYVYQTGEKRPNKEFKAAKLDKCWEFVKGAWVHKELCAEYADNFRPEA